MKIYELFNRKEFVIKVGLDRIKEALKVLNNPEKSFKSVLISGTNGKGSVSAFLESLLRHHGLKVGLYTSPHLVRENERFQINRAEIEDELLDRYIKKVEPLINRFSLSYFETTTIIAFLYFQEKNVDIAVLEVGLGGRWDATNVVYPELSIITNVSFDHTHILGDTLEKIAFEKLGIARRDRPLVVGREQKEILTQAEQQGIKEVYYQPKDFYHIYRHINNLTEIDFYFPLFNTEIKGLKTKMLGKRQGENLSTALSSFLILSKKLGIQPEEKKIREAVFNTKWKGRMEVISQNPLTIIDGSHNLEAIEKTLKEIKTIFPDKKIFIIYSSMEDKDWKKYIQLLKRETEELIFVETSNDRSLKSEKLKQHFPNIKTFKTFPNAYNYTLSKIDKNNNLILILGSLYFIGDVLKKYR